MFLLYAYMLSLLIMGGLYLYNRHLAKTLQRTQDSLQQARQHTDSLQKENKKHGRDLIAKNASIVRLQKENKERAFYNYCVLCRWHAAETKDMFFFDVEDAKLVGEEKSEGAGVPVCRACVEVVATAWADDEPILLTERKNAA